MAILVALRDAASTPMAAVRRRRTLGASGAMLPQRRDRQVAMIASIILCASIIIGVLSITGLGVKITSLILSASGGSCGPRCF
jgi:TRAP-type uncharacterized transport system fused permease subunit